MNKERKVGKNVMRRYYMFSQPQILLATGAPTVLQNHLWGAKRIPACIKHADRDRPTPGLNLGQHLSASSPVPSASRAEKISLSSDSLI